jgi:hypothetical protein
MGVKPPSPTDPQKLLGQFQDTYDIGSSSPWVEIYAKLSSSWQMKFEQKHIKEKVKALECGTENLESFGSDKDSEGLRRVKK